MGTFSQLRISVPKQLSFCGESCFVLQHGLQKCAREHGLAAVS